MSTLVRVLLGAALSTAMFASSAAMGAEAAGSSSAAATITQGNCAPVPVKEHNQVLLGKGQHNLDGWSHIAANTPGLEALQQKPENYRLDLQAKPEPGCDVPVVTALLVKKYHDWDQQHLSGLEAAFPDGAMPLRAIESVAMLLRINSDNTEIPSAKEYRAAYAPWLSVEQLQELDNQQVTLELTLFGANHADQSIASLNASYFLTLEPEMVADQWLEVHIPIQAFTFYMQKDWQETPANFQEKLDHRMIGLRINPETLSGNVVRNYLENDYTEQVPKLFKEIDLSLAQIHLVVNESGSPSSP